jgi:3-oxoadipate enol-lactonase
MQIKANDINIHYELSGKEDAPVVMLSHSLASSLIMWNPQMDLLQSHFRVLRFDTRGHGESDAPEGAYTLDQLGNDAVALLNHLDIDTVHFVGLSMGGMIGQYLALNHSQRLKSLTLCDTAAVMPEEVQPIWQERIDGVLENGMQLMALETLDRWFTKPYLDQNPPEVELIQNQILATPVTGFVGCSEAIRRLDYLENLSQINLPTLIIVGEEDPGTPVAASEAMQARIQGAKLKVLPSAAHLSNIEQAGAFNDTLITFLLGL